MKKAGIFLWILLLVSLTAASQEKENLRVISYNIWNGFDWGKDTKRAEDLQQWMLSQAPDVAALQELCAYDEKRLQQEADQWGHPHSVLLKHKGYSVGLSSRHPIEIKEKILKGMHHGALHCKTRGIDFLVVHLHPGSIEVRRKEMQILLEKINTILESTDKLMVLGDFNAHSPHDAHLYDPEGYFLKRLRENNQEKQGLTGNLIHGDLDYSVISGFLSVPLHDVLRTRKKTLEERWSFPGLALSSDQGDSEEELMERMERIDYILVSEALAPSCVTAHIANGEDTKTLSDHYPVLADFIIEP